MDAFSYLSVLLSIILGLAITQILQGLRGLMQARGRLVVYAPAVTWALLLLVVDVQSWWATYTLRHVQEWNFAAFGVVVAHSICLYMLAALALPDVHGEAPIDLRAHYWGHYRWFFTFVALTALLGIAKDPAIHGHWPQTNNLVCQLAFAAAGGIAASTRSEDYHRLLAPAAVLGFVGYIALLFAQLA
jgi:hypothetical protein